MPIRPKNPNGGATTPAIPDANAMPQAQGRRLVIRRIVPAVDTAAEPLAPETTKRAHHVVDRTTDNWVDGDYLVGRGRPPKSTQWQKGQSGNPRGPKPKEKLDPKAEFDRQALAPFTARLNGQEVEMDLGTFALTAIKGGIAKGSMKSAGMALKIYFDAVHAVAEREGTPEADAWEVQIVEEVLEKLGLPPKPVVRKERGSNLDQGSAQ